VLGFQYAATNPDDAAAFLIAQNPGVFDANKQLPVDSARFLAAGGYYVDADGKVGTQTLAQWTGYSKFLYDQGLLTGPDGKPTAAPPDYASLFTDSTCPDAASLRPRRRRCRRRLGGGTPGRSVRGRPSLPGAARIVSALGRARPGRPPHARDARRDRSSASRCRSLAVAVAIAMDLVPVVRRAVYPPRRYRRCRSSSSPHPVLWASGLLPKVVVIVL
jgi:hypothetical protein